LSLSDDGRSVRTLFVLLTFLSGLAVLGGCGGGGSPGLSGYQQKDLEATRTAVGSVATVLDGLHTLTVPLGNPALAQTFDRKTYVVAAKTLLTALPYAVELIRELGLPPNAQTAQDRFRSAARDVADDSRKAIATVESARRSDLPGLASELDIEKSSAVGRLQVALDEFRSKGYDLGALPNH
jgi:hypothetical protein